MIRFLLVLIVLLSSVIAAILLAEPVIDLTPWRDVIVTWTSKAMGHDLRLEGDITLALGRRVRLDVQDIRIANPDWAGPEPLFRASQFAAGIDFPELLSGVLHVEGVVLRDAATVLVVSETGEQSWDLSPDDESAEAEHEATHGWYLVLEDALAENVSLTYRDLQDGRAVTVQLDRFTQRNDAGILVQDAAGRVNDLDIRLAGHAGPLQSLLAKRDIDLDLHAVLSETDLELTGHLGDPVRLEDMELVATVRGPDFAALLGALGIDYTDDGDIDLEARITDLEQGFAWRSKGHLGSFNLDTAGTLGRPQELDDLQLTIGINGKDLSALGRIIGIRTLPAQPYRMHGDIRRDNHGIDLRDITIVSGDTSLKLAGKLPLFPSVENADVRLEVAMPEPGRYSGLLGINPGLQGALRIDATLATEENSNEVLDAEMSLGRHRMTLEGPLGRYPDYHDTRLKFGLSGPSLAALAGTAGVADLPGGPYRLTGLLEVQEDGAVVLRMDEGSIGNVQLNARGSLGRPPDFDAADLAITLHGNSLDKAAAGIAGISLPDRPFEFRARVLGKLAAPVIGDVDARLGSATLGLKGRVGMPPRFAGTDAQLVLEVPEIGQLLPAAPDAAWTHGSYRLTGRLGSNKDTLQLHDVSIEGEGLRATMEATVPVTSGLAGARLKLNVSGQDLAGVLPAFSHYQPPHAPFSESIRLTMQRGRVEIEQLDLGFAKVRLKGHGWVVPDAAQNKAWLELTASGPRLSELGNIAGIRLPDDDFQITVNLKQTAARLGASKFAAKIGAGESSGDITFETGEHPRIDVVATVRGLDISRYLHERKKGGDKLSPGKKTKPARRLIPDVALPLDFLDALDGHFRVTGTALMYPDPIFTGKALVRNVDLDATLKNGNLVLDTLKVTGDRGEFRAHGRLDQSAGIVKADLAVGLSNFHFGILAVGESLETLPAHELNTSITARGRTYRELAASLNGDIHLTGGKGRTRNAGLDQAFGPFLEELFKNINPFSKKETYTRIKCSAAAMTLVDGVLQMDPGFVIRTDKIDIAATGNIDLNTEKINVSFRNVARKGIGLSAAAVVNPFIKVGGTLTNPGIELDPSKALVSGAAAVATSGLSLLASELFERVKATAVNPCQQLITAAENKLKKNSVPAAR